MSAKITKLPSVCVAKPIRMFTVSLPRPGKGGEGGEKDDGAFFVGCDFELKNKHILHLLSTDILVFSFDDKSPITEEP